MRGRRKGQLSSACADLQKRLIFFKVKEIQDLPDLALDVPELPQGLVVAFGQCVKVCAGMLLLLILKLILLFIRGQLIRLLVLELFFGMDIALALAGWGKSSSARVRRRQDVSR